MIFCKAFLLIIVAAASESRFTPLQSSSARETSKIEEDFAKALVFVKKMPKDVSLTNAEQLAFYANFKIAIEGPCKSPKPSFSLVDLKAPIKWQAWKDLHDKKGIDAMRDYVQLLDEKVPNWRGKV